MRTRLEVLAILAVGWLGFLVYAYPGYMSFDSVQQLREARSGIFTDWHPPMMAELWRLTDSVIAGPFGMLILQSIAFLAGAYLLLARYVKPRIAAIATVLLFWAVPVIVVMAVIWKDSQMIGYLVLGLALLLSERPRNRYIGLAFLLLASTMRHNGFTFTLPMIVLLWEWPFVGWKRYAASFGLWLAISASAFAINGALTVTKLHPWHSTVAMHDIVGTLRYANADDAEIRADLVGTPLVAQDHLFEQVRTVYVPWAGVFTIGPLMRQPQTAEERDAVTAAWKRVVLAHPAFYLKHRFKVFEEVLGLKGMHGPIWVGFDGYGKDLVDDEPSAIQSAMRDEVVTFGGAWFMHPYVYFFAIILLIPFIVKSRDRFLIALAASALTSSSRSGWSHRHRTIAIPCGSCR